MLNVFCVVKMKKVISKYRNQNNGNSQYSLNYKFDSISSAGKINGTALELIKKYNELAKEALSNGNYTEMENFRQYAEHYRKIVTDINEKKSSFKPMPEMHEEIKSAEENKEVNNEPLQDMVPENQEAATPKDEKITKPAGRTLKLKKEFKVVEIKAEKTQTSDVDENAKKEEKPIKRRVVRRKNQADESKSAEE